VIPSTVGAFLALLGLVAPGLVFELRRERRRAGFSDSAFREASRTALYSLLFSGAVLLVMGAARLVWPSGVVDFAAWVKLGRSYFVQHAALVGWNAAVAVTLAVLLALVTEAVTGRKITPTVEKGSIWSFIFKETRPKNTSNWVGIGLTGGERVSGYVDRFSVGKDPDKADMYLVGPGLFWRPAPVPDSAVEPEAVRLDPDWDGLYIRASSVSWIRLKHKPYDE
jgi:hypothetical protein